MLSKKSPMIRWKLREVMARGKVSNRELAAYTNHHETSISRLKMTDTMPRLDGSMLNTLCVALSKIFQEKNLGGIITPADLIAFSFDDDGGNPQDKEKETRANNGITSNPKKGDKHQAAGHPRLIVPPAVKKEDTV